MRTTAEIMAAMERILARAEGRTMTDQEVGEYEALEGELSATARHEQVLARHAAYNMPVAPMPADPGRASSADRADPELGRAFDHYVRTGRANDDISGLRVRNAQGESTPSAGGYLVPTEFRQALIERMKAFGGLQNAVTNFTTGDGRPIEWPTLDDTGNSGEIVSEGGTFSAQSDVSFGSNTLGAYRYASGGTGGNPLRVSVELLQDAAFDIQGLLTRVLGTRIARAQAPHLVSGTGIGQPLGITTGITGTTTAANTGVTYSDLVTWIHTLDPAYRANASWAFNDAFAGTLQNLKDTNGNPIWRPFLNAGMDAALQQGTLLGYPMVIDQAFPNFVANSPTVLFGVFGDLREGYVRRNVQDVTLVVDPYGRAANGQVQYTAWARMDGTQQDKNAYIVLTGHS